MSKYRPEKIELMVPTLVSDEISIMLEDLHKRANLKRVDQDGKTIFSFYPTKSEYFLIGIRLYCKSRENK